MVVKWETDDSTVAVRRLAPLYRVEFSEDRTDWTQIVKQLFTAITGAGKKTYTHSDRTAGTTYYYRVSCDTRQHWRRFSRVVNIHTEASLTVSGPRRSPTSHRNPAPVDRGGSHPRPRSRSRGPSGRHGLGSGWLRQDTWASGSKRVWTTASVTGQSGWPTPANERRGW